jgi:hypothetical protein
MITSHALKAALFLGLATLVALPTFAKPSVKLKNIAAHVLVIPEDRSDITISVDYKNSKLPKIMIHSIGDALVADGKLNYRRVSCKQGEAVDILGTGRVEKDALPLVILKVPKNAHLSIEGASFGVVGATQSLELSIGGCGNWNVDDVRDEARLSVGGSGTINAKNAKRFDVNIGGAGDVRAKSANGLNASIGGSGDITVERIDGHADISVSGSGKVKIASGQIRTLDVSIAGNGDVYFGGEVNDINISIAGSGDIFVQKHTGSIKKSVVGSGNIKIGS